MPDFPKLPEEASEAARIGEQQSGAAEAVSGLSRQEAATAPAQSGGHCAQLQRRDAQCGDVMA